VSGSRTSGTLASGPADDRPSPPDAAVARAGAADAKRVEGNLLDAKRVDGRRSSELIAVGALLEPIAAERGIEVCDVSWTSEGGGRTLRVTIERPLPEGTAWRPELGF